MTDPQYPQNPRNDGPAEDAAPPMPLANEDFEDTEDASLEENRAEAS